MNSIILAGGFGTRLKPLTDSIPKPALKIANRPVLDYVTSQLCFYGITDAVFTLGYKPEIIREICENYDKITARFTVEDKPLGTAGAVKAAENMLDDVFLVMSGRRDKRYRSRRDGCRAPEFGQPRNGRAHDGSRSAPLRSGSARRR